MPYFTLALLSYPMKTASFPGRALSLIHSWEMTRLAAGQQLVCGSRPPYLWLLSSSDWSCLTWKWGRQQNEVIAAILPGNSPWWFLTGLVSDSPWKGSLALWRRYRSWSEACRKNTSWAASPPPPSLSLMAHEINWVINDRVISLKVSKLPRTPNL